MKESVLRTLVPILYALLIKAGLDQLGLDDVVLQQLATLLATGLLYVALRLLERHQKAVGWLLGYAKQPVYIDPPTPPKPRARARKAAAKTTTAKRRTPTSKES